MEKKNCAYFPMLKTILCSKLNIPWLVLIFIDFKQPAKLKSIDHSPQVYFYVY